MNGTYTITATRYGISNLLNTWAIKPRKYFCPLFIQLVINPQPDIKKKHATRGNPNLANEAKNNIDNFFSDSSLGATTIFVRTPAEASQQTTPRGNTQLNAMGILGGLEAAPIPN